MKKYKKLKKRTLDLQTKLQKMSFDLMKLNLPTTSCQTLLFVVNFNLMLLFKFHRGEANNFLFYILKQESEMKL
jgi:hypothetical protein